MKNEHKHYNTILLLGSGALKIGEAGEFDYSGTQAIKALKEEGKKVILINPNIATIQTSEGLADKVYFLPVQPYFVEQVIQKEKPEGIMISFGGQTALNCGMELAKSGVLKKYTVDILGTPIQAVIDTEDRELFAQRLAKIGLKTAQGKIVKNMAEGLAFAREIRYPVMMRTGFALGGTGSGVAENEEKLTELLKKAFATSSQVILEESLKGWKEIEYEVVRDKDDNCITVCNMENFDPVGIHTGESIVIAPSQTLNNEEYYRLRQIAIQAIREFKIVGECNIQYALNPHTSDYRIIEVNARLSRSSALASKATGYPLAYVAAKLALGKTLPELKNFVTGQTSAFFEPALDYVVVKMPRWDLDKYTKVSPQIGSEMKSVGEVMSIGRSFEEAIQKAARMLNDGYYGVIDKNFTHFSKTEALEKVKIASSMRLFAICSALYAGVSVEELHKITEIDFWFLRKLENIVQFHRHIEKNKKLDKLQMREAKKLGFSDKQLGDLIGKTELEVRTQRKKLHVLPVVKRIDTMAGEFPAQTNYLYMTYHGEKSDHESNPKEKKAIVIGSGPYSIGTSVEFDWCAVNTVKTLKAAGIAGVMLNCNPETVSTDYDNSDYLYFEELSFERVMDIFDLENSPFVLSVGGQIPNNLAPKLEKAAVPILGTSAANIYRAEHRQTFSQILDELHIPQPMWVEATSAEQALSLCQKIGFPVLVRPSFVLSGKAMAVLESERDLEMYMSRTDLDFQEHPLVITRFLNDAKECDFDGVAANGNIVLSAISEHVEGGGVHSGDSTLVLPPMTFSEDLQKRMSEYAKNIAAELQIHGPFNIQFLVVDDIPYVIECNLRASRSFPFISKTKHINFIEVATKVLLNKKVTKVAEQKLSYTAVKVPQFSFHKLRGADPILRVEMSSTGEVAAFGKDPYEAYLKGILATGTKFPEKKAVFLSLGGLKGKLTFLKSCVRLVRMGYTLYSTSGTAFFLRENGLEAQVVGKIHEEKHPNIMDLIQQKKIDFAVVVPGNYQDQDEEKRKKVITDGYLIRRAAIDFGISLFTNTQTAAFFVEALHKYKKEDVEVQSWNSYISK